MIAGRGNGQRNLDCQLLHQSRLKESYAVGDLEELYIDALWCSLAKDNRQLATIGHCLFGWISNQGDNDIAVGRSSQRKKLTPDPRLLETLSKSGCRLWSGRMWQVSKTFLRPMAHYRDENCPAHGSILTPNLTTFQRLPQGKACPSEWWWIWRAQESLVQEAGRKLCLWLAWAGKVLDFFTVEFSAHAPEELATGRWCCSVLLCCVSPCHPSKMFGS